MTNQFIFNTPFWVVNDDNPALPLSQGIDWGAAMIKIHQVHALRYKGKGIKVAVIDTSSDVNHPDLRGAITKTLNATRETYRPINHHSTGVCGIIGARDNEIGVVSMAPECEIIAIKALYEHGGGSLGDIIKAIDMAIDEKVHIINMSLGTTADVPQLHEAVKRAHAAGIVIVCAAGNTGQEGVNFPAAYEECIAVGAINSSGKVSSFSTRGLQLETAAPGETVLTTFKNNGWARLSGTSFACPGVAGIAALALQAGIKFTPQLLKETSIDIEEPGFDIKAGYGLINPVAIMDRRDAPQKPSSSSSVKPIPLPIDTAPVKAAVDILSKAVLNVRNVANRTALDLDNISKDLAEANKQLSEYLLKQN